jgi:hypothetical protein
MKKATILFLAVTMIASAMTFFGCQKKEEAPPPSEPGVEQPETPAPEQEPEE